MADGTEAGSSGAGQKALAVVQRAHGRFNKIPAARRTWMLVAVTGLVAAISLLAWYVGRPDWKPLMSGMEAKDVQQVAQELTTAQIAFQITADGTGIQVPADALDKARIEIATKGLPPSGRLGFELFDKPNWVGSEFDERVNYQRALEGELEHTIETLGVVKSARVHLVLPQASLFLSEQKMAKASVVLKLKRSGLDPQQADSVRNLVAGAVENLNTSQVTLVDADGRINLEARSRGQLAADEEHGMEDKLVAMLEPLAGAGNVRATVNVTYDETSEEHTDEIYDPDHQVTLTSQKSEQSSAGSRAAQGAAQGVPGTASNTPAAAPENAVQGSAAAAAPGTPPLLQQKAALPVYPQNGNGQGQTMKQESATYGATRHIIHSEVGPGRVKRVTAAVVVNDRMTVEGAAKTLKSVWKPRTSEEMHRLEQLAQAAVGFDEDRGDQVVIENVSFSSNQAEPEPVGVDKVMQQAKSVLSAQPALLKMALIGVLGLALIAMVLRPVARELATVMKAEPPALASAGDAEGSTKKGLNGAVGRPGELPVGVTAGQFGYSAITGEPFQSQEDREAALFEEVTAHIKREPAHSTRLLESWIAIDGEE